MMFPKKYTVIISCTIICQYTHGSNTNLEMYSFGIRGNWYEKTLFNPNNQSSFCDGGCSFNEFWRISKWITPFISSCFAAWSRETWSLKNPVWKIEYQYNYQSVEQSFTSGPTIPCGSVIVATISRATSIASLSAHKTLMYLDWFIITKYLQSLVFLQDLMFELLYEKVYLSFLET